MEHHTALDTSHYKSQPGTGSSMNTNTTIKASAMKMKSKTGGTSDTADTPKDNSSTCYICSQDGHISRNDWNSNMMNKPLHEALFVKDAQSQV